MVLYPNTPFTDGDFFIADLATLAFNQVFDDQTQWLGHKARLTDDSLSNVAGNIKGRVGNIADAFLPTVVSGLTINIATGTLVLPNGTNLLKPTQNIVVPNNANTFIYADGLGTITSGTTPPVVRRLLAFVIASGGVVTSLTDLRDAGHRQVQPQANVIRTFGGSSTTDFTATNGMTLEDGEYYFRNFTVPSGVLVTVSAFARIICSGNVVIAGQVTVTPASRGCAPLAYDIGAGTVLSAGAGQGLGTSGAGYPYSAQPFGTGGNGCIAFAPGASWFWSAPGGGGGGCFWIEAAGTINVTGVIFAQGGDGGIGGANAAKNPVSGAGGGATCLVSGSGAGSGGLIRLSSTISITIGGSAILSVQGGVGGNAISNGLGTSAGLIGGGFGGSGGYIVLGAPSINTTGATLDLAGGFSGVPAGGTAAGVNTWTMPNWYTPPSGGSFAGDSAGITVTGVTPNLTYVRGQSTIGRLITLNFIPIG